MSLSLDFVINNTTINISLFLYENILVGGWYGMTVIVSEPAILNYSWVGGRNSCGVTWVDKTLGDYYGGPREP